MTQTRWMKAGLIALLMAVMFIGYGGLCDVNKDETTIAGSSAPIPSAVSSLLFSGTGHIFCNAVFI